MKIEIEIPDGIYCTGCPCTMVISGGRDVSWHYGCTLLHTECKSEGEFQNRAIKHPMCLGRSK
jgi:hypothetical protein